MKLSMKDIEGISDELSSGLLVYINLENNKIIALPTEDDMDYYDDNPWQDALDEVASWGNTLMIEPLESSQCFRFMEEFLSQVENDDIRNSLQYALCHRKPFAHFQDLIYKFGLKESWFPFKDKRYMQEVIKGLPVELTP